MTMKSADNYKPSERHSTARSNYQPHDCSDLIIVLITQKCLQRSRGTSDNVEEIYTSRTSLKFLIVDNDFGLFFANKRRVFVYPIIKFLIN